MTALTQHAHPVIADTVAPAVLHPALPTALTSSVPIQAFVGPHGTLVHMFAAGAGAPVLAIHGSGMHGQMWRGMLSGMNDEFRLHCPDLYGYGQSEPLPMQQRMTLEDNAKLIGALLRRFDRPVHVVGHAFGAAVALRAALDHPACLASMTLYEPLALHLLKPECGGHAPAQRQIETMAGDMRIACLRGETREAARLFYDHCSGPGAFDAQPEQRRIMLAVQAPRLCLDMGMAFGPSQASATYRSLRMPVLLLNGSRSSGTLRLIAERLAGVLPLVRHAILPELGHLAPVTHPEVMARVILPFLNVCERALPQHAKA